VRTVRAGFIAAFLLALLGGTFAYAFEERTFDTPKDEALFDTLVAELRCLVCQNQNIADSNAELAVDLRREIFSMIQADKNNTRLHGSALWGVCIVQATFIPQNTGAVVSAGIIADAGWFRPLAFDNECEKICRRQSS